MSFSHHLRVRFSGFVVFVDELNQVGSHDKSILNQDLVECGGGHSNSGFLIGKPWMWEYKAQQRLMVRSNDREPFLVNSHHDGRLARHVASLIPRL